MAKTAGKNMVQPIKVELSGPRRVYDGFLKLDSYEVSHERFDGRMSEKRSLEVMERGDAASVILVDPDEEDVFLVEQFRLPIRLRGGSGWLLETAAGMIRAGETPQECLRREVIEETGYQVTELEEIAPLLRLARRHHGAHLPLLRGGAGDRQAREGGGVVKDGENIRIERMKIEEFFAKLDRREFEDAKPSLPASGCGLGAPGFRPRNRRPARERSIRSGSKEPGTTESR